LTPQNHSETNPIISVRKTTRHNTMDQVNQFNDDDRLNTTVWYSSLDGYLW